jgi:hypothetical protein
MATEAKGKDKPFGRSLRYAVVPIDAVRMLNVRTDEEVIEAQKGVNDDMLRALEEMINAARAGRLEGRAVLGLAAGKW